MILVYRSIVLLECIILLHVSYTLDAQNFDHYQFSSITTENGLADNSISCIHQDSKGYIWIGTSYGLSRYDAYDMTNYRFIPSDTTSISDNYITAMTNDSVAGNLWVATQNGLNYYNRVRDCFTRYLISDSLNSTQYFINDLLFTENHGLMLATNQGVLHFSLSESQMISNLTTRLNNELSSDVLNLTQDRYERIWIGTRNGLGLYNPVDESINKVNIPISNDKPLYIYDIFEDSRKNILISTRYHGFIILENGSPNHTKVFNTNNTNLKNNWINNAVEWDEGIYFLSVRDGGLVLLDSKTSETRTYTPDLYDLYNKNNISTTALTTIFLDVQGNLWIGTYHKGVSLLDINKKPFRHYKVTGQPDGLINNNIRAVFQDSENRIWIGTKEGGGISEFLPEQNRFIHYLKDKNNPNSINDDFVFSIEELTKDVLMVGTFRGGINLFDKSKKRFRAIKQEGNRHLSELLNAVYCIHKDKKNRIWVGTLKNLCLLDLESETLSLIDSVFEVKIIFEDKSGQLWFTNRTEGLLYFDEKNDIVRKFDFGAKEMLPQNRINSITEDANGNLWIATGESGIIKIEKDRTSYSIYGKKNGLPSNQTFGILEDDQLDIWVSTSMGISRFNINDSTFTNYGTYDGLGSTTFEQQICLKLKNGELIFGGNNGFIRFQPLEIIENQFVPPVYLTDIKISNRSISLHEPGSPLKVPVSETEELKLKFNQSDITFEFTALNYSVPEKNQYAYKLEGFDKTWVKAGKERKAIYTNLDPGKYVFRVRGSNNDGVWNNTGTQLYLTIRPPFWNTALAYFIYLIALVTILNALYRYFKLKANYQKNLLKERLQRKKEEEIHQFKLRFFTNISHEFRTPLTLIAGPLQHILNSYDLQEELKKQIEVVFRNATLLLQQINQLMDFRKIEVGKPELSLKETDIVSLIKERLVAFEPIVKQRELSISFSTSFDAYEALIDAGKLNSILNNLLSNAIKFSKPKGTITISFAEKSLITPENLNEYTQIVGTAMFPTSEFFEIAILDSGIGIEKSDFEKVFQRYFQVKPTSGESKAGTGIGLAVVKSFVEIHEGNLFLRSKQSAGTTFILQFHKLTLSRLNELSENVIIEPEIFLPESHEPIVETHSDRLEEETMQNLSLLIVDDNEDMLIHLNSILGNRFRVFLESDPIQGLEKARTNIPDLIVSDIMMPELDGIEFCKRIKTDERTCHIPVILLTAKTSLESHITGYETGADAYIAKPFNSALLIAQIVNLVSQRKKLKSVFSHRIEVNPKEITMNSMDEKFLKRALDCIEDNMANAELNPDFLCKYLGMSRTSLHVKLKALTDLSTTEFIRTIRLKRARQLLDTGGFSINEIVYMVGFNSPSYFSKCFKEYFGKSPTQIQNKTT